MGKLMFYRVVRVTTYHFKNLRGYEKVAHDFKVCYKAHSLDSCLDFISNCCDGRFRVVRTNGKKFFRTLNCIKLNDIIEFYG